MGHLNSLPINRKIILIRGHYNFPIRNIRRPGLKILIYEPRASFAISVLFACCTVSSVGISDAWQSDYSVYWSNNCAAHHGDMLPVAQKHGKPIVSFLDPVFIYMLILILFINNSIFQVSIILTSICLYLV